MKVTLLAFVMMLILSGCSQEPSNAEVRKGVELSLKEDFANIGERKVFGVQIMSAVGMDSIDINSIEKIGCKADGQNAAICEVATDYTLKAKDGGLMDVFGVAGRQKSVQKFRFVKTSKGWIVANSVADSGTR